MQTDASEQRLLKYELLRPLGSGGMGEVYLARDTRLRRQVAIKFVSPARLADPGANARLLREARAAATLDHPGICAIYDVDVDPRGRTCIVMQYVEGETLAARLARGAITPAEAVALAAAVADALAAAHARGIVHRDLKPQNVMVTPDGRPKLLDFGIAFADVAPEVAAEVATHTATGEWAPGALVGTPAYMSPEQVLRKAVDARSDLFSLGAVLFECLTGTAAFQAASDIDTWARVVYVTPPPPSLINPGVSGALDAIVARLLAKDPADRPSSAGEVARTLRSLGAARRAIPRRRRALVAGGAIVVVAAGGYAAWRVARPHAAPPPPAAQEYYDRGLQHLRDGAYARAEKVLDAAVAAYPRFPQALARVAEARNELDEETSAQDAVVRIGDLTRAGLVLPPDDAVRVDAISALLENDVSRAEAGYRTLAERHPDDRGAWLDLARVRQTAELKEEARRAALRALQISPNYAAAHLRLASLAADALQRDEAIREFKEAERLYAVDSLTEGQAEAILQRAIFLDGIGDVSASRQALSEADPLLATVGSAYQQVRALTLRSQLAASAGDLQQARRVAQDAVATAQAANLDTVAADALIQSGTTLMQQHDYDGARADLQRGVDLAKRSGAKRIAVRGTLQLASLFLDIGRPIDARNLANGMLDFTHERYPRLEMAALSIVGRSQEGSDVQASATIARRVLKMARELHDSYNAQEALDSLIATSTTLGSLPEALDLRVQREQIDRQANDSINLALDLTGRSDLLVRLGRFADAEQPLGEIDAGIAAGNKAFATRARRAGMLRALAAAESRDFAAAVEHAADVLARSAVAKAHDSTLAISEAVLLYARASLGRHPENRPWTPVAATAISSELRYWRATARLANRDVEGAGSEAAQALAELEKTPSAEVEWRMAAIASIAARSRGDASTAERMKARAQAALSALRTAWKQQATAYEGRADLAGLRRAAGLSENRSSQ